MHRICHWSAIVFFSNRGSRPWNKDRGQSHHRGSVRYKRGVSVRNCPAVCQERMSGRGDLVEESISRNELHSIVTVPIPLQRPIKDVSEGTRRQCHVRERHVRVEK